jgi:hypothetical protein
MGGWECLRVQRGTVAAVRQPYELKRLLCTSMRRGGKQTSKLGIN